MNGPACELDVAAIKEATKTALSWSDASAMILGTTSPGSPDADIAPPSSKAAKHHASDSPSSRSSSQSSTLPAAMADVLCKYIDSCEDPNEPVVRLMAPDMIRGKFDDAGIPLSLLGKQAPQTQEMLLQATELLLRYSVRTNHPLFFNQLFARVKPVAIAADWAAVATNSSCYTYEVAPVYSLMEREVLAKVASLIGGAFAGPNAHDGLFVPGGSLCNLYAMHLAHNVADPDFNTRGAVGGPRCVAFVSDQSHYSYLKSAKLTGIGSDNLITVKSDSRGRMCPTALEAAVQEAVSAGKKPFLVGTTAGTTVLGAYDPFDAIAAICHKHSIWLHVDGAWGGGALLSDKHSHLMSGVNLADSFSWNPHKMCGSTLQCSIFVTRHPDLLQSTNGTKAAYLFQKDKLYAELDSGDKTFQCGRRTDMFKIWLQWKAMGDEGMCATVDHCFELANSMATSIRNDATGAWKLVYEPSCTNVCFWYVPKCLRPFSWDESTQSQRDKLHKVAPLIKSEMQRRGDAMIGFQSINGRPNFFRMVFASADILSQKDIEAMMTRLAAIGEEQCSNLS